MRKLLFIGMLVLLFSCEKEQEFTCPVTIINFEKIELTKGSIEFTDGSILIIDMNKFKTGFTFEAIGGHAVIRLYNNNRLLHQNNIFYTCGETLKIY